MQKIKLGIVGFGFMGHCDADMMKTFQNIDLVAGGGSFCGYTPATA